MKQLWQTLITEWWARPLPESHPRSVDLQKYLDLGIKKVISVVGFRRVGKTYLLFDLAKKVGQKKCVYINFEDERIPKETQSLTAFLDVLTELGGKESFVLLCDEIQNIPGWSHWARRVVETTDHQLFISGSSSKLASSELPTELRGRSLNIKVDPLNFNEFMKFKGISALELPLPQLLNFTREYLTYGGFPEVALVDEGKKYLIIDEYFQTFLQRDIVERHNIRKDRALSILINLILNSKQYGVRKLTNTISSLEGNLGKHTVTRFLGYLEESYFLTNLYFFSPNLKNRFQAEKKCYFVDSSFISQKANAFSDNIGRLMEQKVFEKLNGESNVSPNRGVYYWKDYDGREIDFVLREKEDTTKLIQVTYVSDVRELETRETKALVRGAKKLNCRNLEIVTWDLEVELTIDGYQINCIPLWKYLLV